MMYPSTVIHYDGKFIRCYPYGSRRSMTQKPVRMEQSWSGLTDLIVDGVTVVQDATAISMIGRKYREVEHIFVGHIFEPMEEPEKL